MKKNKAFTLIEILVSIGIIGIIAGIVIFQMNGAANAGKDSRRKVDIEAIKSAIVSYRAENNNKVPVESCDIGKDCSSLPTALKAFAGTLPSDPESGTYYHYESSDGTNCKIYATLSTGEIYEYDCQSSEISTVTPVDGVCGNDNNETLSATPTNLCNQGTPSALVGSGPWLWTCNGENEGKNSSCHAYLSDDFTCAVMQGDCAGADILHMYDPAGGHAEMPDQSNYTWKVCCSGGGVKNTCGGLATTVLKLYDTTKSHVEKNTQDNGYAYQVCIGATGKNAYCGYASDCSTLGSGYVCLASIPDGDYSLHIGNCSAFTQKVCCKIQTIQ